MHLFGNLNAVFIYKFHSKKNNLVIPQVNKHCILKMKHKL